MYVVIRIVVGLVVWYLIGVGVEVEVEEAHQGQGVIS